MSESFGQIPQNVQGQSVGTIRGGRHSGNVRGNSGKSLRRRLPSDKLNNREITTAISQTLFNVPAKEIAEATGGSIRAAQNVREGLNAMSLTGFLNACRSIPELRALAMEMIGCEAETDPDFVRGVTLLMNSYARKQLEGSNGC